MPKYKNHAEKAKALKRMLDKRNKNSERMRNAQAKRDLDLDLEYGRRKKKGEDVSYKEVQEEHRKKYNRYQSKSSRAKKR